VGSQHCSRTCRRRRSVVNAPAATRFDLRPWRGLRSALVRARSKPRRYAGQRTSPRPGSNRVVHSLTDIAPALTDIAPAIGPTLHHPVPPYWPARSSWWS
jgi:hypothetical protein